ncbi:serine/threonine-protein phosphatase [bacterium]|nr:serine/threonine-protein phosphatase [bacterium]
MSAGTSHQHDTPRIGRTLLNDLQTGNLKRTFMQDMRDIYHFYIDRDQKKRLREMGKIKAFFILAWWILKSLFFKLTPLRRVMLVVSLILSAQTSTVTIGNSDVGVDFDMIGRIILLMILLLELKDKLLARSELAAGRSVQSSFIPPEAPSIPGWDIYLCSRPANDVGGDLIDYMPLHPGTWGFAIGDVAGKGLGAALLMARMIATLRSIAPAHESLTGLCNAVNTIFCRDGIPSRFISLLYLHLRPESGSIEFVNAGHMPPIIAAEKGPRELGKGGPAIGLTRNAVFQQSTLTVGTGEFLVLYSDGVIDAVNSRGEFFGQDRFRDILGTIGRRSARAAGETIFAAIDRFAGTARQSDDISLLLLKRTG